SGGPTTEENISIDLNNAIIVDDGIGDSAKLQGSVAIIDDVPIAANDPAQVNEGGTGTTNFLLTIDVSASMNTELSPGVTRLDLEKAALINLLNSANVNEVFIVDFNTTTHDSGGWLNKADAITFIQNLIAVGFTNYDAGITDAESAFTFAHTGADQTLAYFLS